MGVARGVQTASTVIAHPLLVELVLAIVVYSVALPIKLVIWLVKTIRASRQRRVLRTRVADLEALRRQREQDVWWARHNARLAAMGHADLIRR